MRDLATGLGSETSLQQGMEKVQSCLSLGCLFWAVDQVNTGFGIYLLPPPLLPVCRRAICREHVDGSRDSEFELSPVLTAQSCQLQHEISLSNTDGDLSQSVLILWRHKNLLQGKDCFLY